MMKRLYVLPVLLAFLTSLLLGNLGIQPKVDAANAANWQAGRIIDDSIFTDSSAMTVSQIQTFLNQKVGTGGYGLNPGQCDTNGIGTSEYGGGTRAQFGAAHGNPAPFTCLKDYYEVPKTSPGPGVPASNYGGAAIPAGAKSAAQLIWDAAQNNHISPKVLLVTIQKESAGPLTTDDWPFRSQYTYAMGAHCPDSGPGGSANCDENYAGFSIQISESAALLRWYLDNMNQPWWSYKKPGNNDILYNPNTGCGSSTVYIVNQSTAALYTYTPYQPNQAALNNLYGTGDSCSAYGNRNFWRIFTDWFGSTYGDLVMAKDGSIYKLENDQKRAFPSEIVFLSYGYLWSDVVPRSDTELSQIPAGAAMPYNVHYRDGQLITSDGSNIYLIVDGQKRNIPSESVFLSYSWKWSYIRTISAQEFNYIPAGAAMPYNVHYRDGQLIRATGSTGVYLVQNGTKRAFPSAEIFLSYGHQWSLITNISSEELGLIPPGQDLPYNVHYRDGQLITMDGNSIYLINNGQKRNIPSESVFLSYSWKWSYIRTISAQEFNYIPAGDPVPYNTNG